MRDKFLLILLFFLLMAAIPLGFLTRQSRTSPQEFGTPDEAFDAQAASAASLCKSSFCHPEVGATGIQNTAIFSVRNGNLQWQKGRDHGNIPLAPQSKGHRLQQLA